MTDAEIMEQVRSGAVLKYCGRGVVVINYGWWVKLLEKTGFRIVPTLEDMMADRTTVIDALERCARLQDAPMSGECAECAYKEDIGTCSSLSRMMMDSAELLKEKPVIIDGNSVISIGRCPVCKTALNPWKAGYCWKCGQAVKWDD